MWHQHLQLGLFLFSLLLLCLQLGVRKKQAVHVWFAVFCGSVAIMALQRWGGSDWGAWQYLIGFGACLTCNGYWLVARSLFRQDYAVSSRHVAVALVVAVLVIAHQFLQLAQTQWHFAAEIWQRVDAATVELLSLCSSTLLMLTLWEGGRGLYLLPVEERRQRLLFSGSFALALSLCLIFAKVWPAAATDPAMQQSLAGLAAIWMLGVTQLLIWWRFPRVQPIQIAEPVPAESPQPVLSTADDQLLHQLNQALLQQRLYLQPNLKVADLARKYEVPEYRISRVLRHAYPQWHFNQLINELRIGHAKQLLADPANRHWPVLVVGLESGFGSAGPFSRAFKAATALTPHEYRQQCLQQLPVADRLSVL